MSASHDQRMEQPAAGAAHNRGDLLRGASGTDVRENVEQHRFELPIADGAFAAAYYRMEKGQVVLIHTEVPFAYSGQGMASRLAQGTFEWLRATGRKAIPTCPFMSDFLVKHPQYSDVVAGSPQALRGTEHAGRI